MFTWMSDGVGENGTCVIFTGGEEVVPFGLLSSWTRMRWRIRADISPESCRRPLYDSIMKAVTTAENRPALKGCELRDYTETEG